MIYVVVTPGAIVLGVYTREDLAHMHMRTVTGAVVVPALLRDALPLTVIDELGEDFDDDPTPVTEPFKKT